MRLIGRFKMGRKKIIKNKKKYMREKMSEYRLRQKTLLGNKNFVKCKPKFKRRCIICDKYFLVKHNGRLKCDGCLKKNDNWVDY